MPPDTWLRIGQAIAAVGGVGTIGALAKWIYDQQTGRHDRKTRAVRSAIDAMRDAGQWAEAYWALRGWVLRTFGYLSDMPPPPGEDHE